MNPGTWTLMRYPARIFSLVVALAWLALSAGSCANNTQTSASSTSSAEAAPPAPRLAARTWTPAATPAEIAAWANEGCPGQGQPRLQCLEKALLSVIEPSGVDKAMKALETIAAKDEWVRAEGHVVAHGIGIAAYRTPETVAGTFARCTPEFQSGCYHGVIQAYFADGSVAGQGVGADKLNALCRDYRGPAGRWLDFQCAHGMGHGLMAVNDHHLVKALDGCDLLTVAFERESCYGGAFMENIINVTNPHHTATTSGDEHAGHQASGGHADKEADGHGGHEGHDAKPADEHAGGHDHAAMADAEPFKALDPAQPLYPCTIVSARQLRACYQMQTSAILYQNKGDFAATARECENAPADEVRTCFVSLGRDANSYGRGVHEKVIELCSQAPAARRAWCFVGAVKNMMDVTARIEDGVAFCRKLPGDSKPACYRAVGQHVWVLVPDDPGRERACQTVERGYLAECREGALLPIVRDSTKS
jgi:hypothetical protein